eukprot:Nk52_evm61s1073 gene=Nk52_evmTU61s1073
MRFVALSTMMDDGHVNDTNDQVMCGEEETGCSDCYDALIVPGGGIQDEDGNIPPWTARRLEYAYSVYVGQINKGQKAPIFLVLSAGSPHKPPLINKRGFLVHECTGSSDYLLRRGVPAEHVVREWSSFDTIGNAYFARVEHTDICMWTRLLVVTSQFHMPRTKAIFEWVFSLPRSEKLPGMDYSLDFKSVSDHGAMDPQVLAMRIEKEQNALKSLNEKISRFNTLAKLHTFMYSEHKAYVCKHPDSLDDEPPALPESLLKSY